MLKLKIIFILLLIIDIFAYGNYKYRSIKIIQLVRARALVVVDRPIDLPKTQSTKASWYDRSTCDTRIYGVNCKTANGEIFDEAKFTAACSSLFKFGDNVELCHLGKCIRVLCDDRGNFKSLGRDFDLTPAAFNALADTDRGVIKVEYRIIK